MANFAPYNIIMSTATVYIAPVGTAMPDVYLATPAGPWAVLGTSGQLDYDDDGVVLTTNQTFGDFTGAGSTIARKVSRLTEDFQVEVALVDMTLESLLRAFNNNAITSNASGGGNPGRKVINIYQGADVATMAICTRVYTPYIGDANAFFQIEQPNAYNAAGISAPFKKGDAAGYKLMFKSLIDPNNPTSANRLGQLRAYTSAYA
jgi:hypothetical protein